MLYERRPGGDRRRGPSRSGRGHRAGSGAPPGRGWAGARPAPGAGTGSARTGEALSVLLTEPAFRPYLIMPNPGGKSWFSGADATAV